MDNFWNYHIFNNSVKDWIIAIGVIVVCIVGLRLLQAFLIKRVQSLVSKTKTTIDDFIIDTVRKSLMPLLYLLIIHFALQYLALDPKVQSVEHIAMMLVITFFLLKIATSFIAYVFRQAVSKTEKNEQREKQSKGILLIVQVIIWCLGFLFLIDNLGYDITTLVAGLGIGGIAIALAAQTILGDLFSYFVIFFDKPFEIGDFIITGTDLGTVEYIGIKTTRIRTLSGEQLICSNTDLTNSRVHNYKRMQERRVVFTFGVVYGTPAAKLKAIPPMVEKIIKAQEATRFDRAHFKEFAEFKLNFEVVYYVLSADYNIYMDIQQQINLQIFQQLEQMEVAFGLPMQTVFLGDQRQKAATAR